MTALASDEIRQRVQSSMSTVEPRTTDNGQPYLSVPVADLTKLLQFLRDDPALWFDTLMDLTGYDLLRYPSTPATPVSDDLVVVYLLWSHVHRHKTTVKVLAPRAACRVPTASQLWPAALYFEREVWDLLGVHFEGHPSLSRIMCPEDWVGHPLRKDYLYPDVYHGVAHLREGQHFEQVPAHVGSPAVEPPTKRTHP